jgi:hypothetical protein
MSRSLSVWNGAVEYKIARWMIITFSVLLPINKSVKNLKDKNLIAINIYCTIIIIIIIILDISFMQGIYTYIPETNHVPREHCVATILM